MNIGKTPMPTYQGKEEAGVVLKSYKKLYKYEIWLSLQIYKVTSRRVNLEPKAMQCLRVFFLQSLLITSV